MPPETAATLPALFEKSADRFGTRPMILEKADGAWKSFTYHDVRTMVHRCAAGLIRLGVMKQDRIALISEGRREWVVAELGILYAGAVNVPVSVKIDELSNSMRWPKWLYFNLRTVSWTLQLYMALSQWSGKMKLKQ